MAPLFTGLRLSFGRSAEVASPPILTVIKPDTTTTTIDLTIEDFNFSTAGPYTITVNGGPKAVLLKSWGSGGKEGYDGPGAGGGGGYAEGIISLQEGISYQVIIGSGGGTAPTYAPGNAPIPYGGGGGSQVAYDSPGGGFSGLFITSISHANSVLISGGGGGTYPGANGSYVGGGGGGTTGQNASTPYNFTISGGGTQGAGGTAGSAPGGTGSAGGVLVGGAGHPVAGGGGGGGYYGGGGGGGSAGQGQQGAGGGGSGYTNPSYILSPELIQASGSTAANGSDPDRGTAGNGGNNSTGSPGRFIIRLI